MNDISYEELARIYGYNCTLYKGEIAARIKICNDKRKEISNYAKSLSSVVETIDLGSQLASLAAGYFDQGAYKDGITNFSGDLSSMVTDANAAVTSLNNQISTINTYLSNLTKHINALVSVKSKWENACNYYEKHKDEIMTF